VGKQFSHEFKVYLLRSSVLPALVFCLIFSACFHFPCEAEKVSDSTSTNRQLTASVIWIECGAMGKDATWVTLHRTTDKPDRSQEVIFSAVEQTRRYRMPGSLAGR